MIHWKAIIILLYIRLRKHHSPSRRNLLEDKVKDRKPLFVCKAISAGSRHSLVVMIDCQKYDFVPGQVRLPDVALLHT